MKTKHEHKEHLKNYYRFCSPFDEFVIGFFPHFLNENISLMLLRHADKTRQRHLVSSKNLKNIENFH